MSYGSSNDGFFPTEESEAWRTSAGFVSGDFYREPDNVCRGVTFAAADIPPPGPENFKGFAEGDYYREPDICQGFAGFEPPPFPGGLSKLGFGVDAGYSSVPLSKELAVDRFTEGRVPPNPPADSFFKFEITTVFVTSSAPFEIGNHLLDFFCNEVSSDLTKVRPLKFTIKGDVFADGMMCTLKVRVYNQPMQYAIEFQRRSGDTVAFNTVFKQAKGYLSQRLAFAAQSAEAAVPGNNLLPPPLPMDNAGTAEADISVVLDLCGSGAPFLQAEAANTLHKLVCEGNPNVCSSKSFQSIRELLQTSSTDVAYPTATMISKLAQQPEAAPFFASEGLLAQMVEQVRTGGGSAQVRLQLAQALDTAVQRQSTATLGQDATQTLIFTLRSALKEMSCENVSQEVVNCLSKAEVALQYQFPGCA